MARDHFEVWMGFWSSAWVVSANSVWVLSSFPCEACDDHSQVALGWSVVHTNVHPAVWIQHSLSVDDCSTTCSALWWSGGT